MQTEMIHVEANGPRFAVDRRGDGHSDRPRGVAAYCMTELLADVAALIDAAREWLLAPHAVKAVAATKAPCAMHRV